MKTISWFIILIIAPTLTGCSNPPSEQGSEIRDSNSPPQPPEKDPPSPPADPKTNSTQLPPIIFSQCTGFTGSTIPYLRPLGPGEAPPGWEPDNPAVFASYVGLAGYDCQRMHIGPYERGPLRMIWDGHDNVDMPPQCQEGREGTHIASLINSIIINDREIATYLEQTYGLPAQYAEIKTQKETISSVKQHTWSWGPGETPSQIRFTDDGSSAPYDSGERLFWQWEKGIGRIDFSYVRETVAYTSRDGEGTMEPPMILAEEEPNVFIGPIFYIPSMNGEGEIQLFEDLFCENPVEDS